MKFPPSTLHTTKQKTTASETFYINRIFEADSEGHYTNRALLYQDILGYFKITLKKVDERERLVDSKKIKEEAVKLQTDPHSSRIRELERWLIKNNKQFRYFYTDSKSHTTMSARIANNDKLIKSCISELESSQLLAKIEIVKSTKNSMPTPVYSLSDPGVIISLLKKYKDAQPRDKLKIQQLIFHLIQRYFSAYNSHICDFIMLLYAKSMQKGFANSMIDLLFEVMHSDNYRVHTLADVLNIVLHLHLLDQQKHNHFHAILVETINELEERTKNVVMYHLKADIESQIHLFQPPKDWEEMWIKNIQDCSKFVLYGICNKCSQRYPVLVDFFLFQKDASLTLDCNRCNSKDTLQVHSTIP